MKSEGRSCACKQPMTRDEALNVCREVRARGARTRNLKHNNIRAYKCAFCDHWHVGHNAPPKHSKYKRIRRFHVPLHVPAVEGEE